MQPRLIGEHLIAHPGISFGKVTFKGTRVPVKTVLNFMAMGDTIDDILKAWPQLKREAVVEALEMAAIAVDECWKVPKRGFKQANEPTHSRRAR